MNPSRQQFNLWLPTMVAFGLVALVLVTAFAMFVVGADSEEFPSYLGAVATTLAVIAASIAAWHAWGAFRVESERLQMLVDDRRSAQAASVAAWLLEPVIGEVDEHAATGRPALLNLGVAIHNASALPVTSVRLEVALAVRSSRSGPLAADGDTRARAIAGQRYAVIGPYHQFQTAQLPLVPPLALADLGVADQAELLERLSVQLEFRDAANRQWRRSFDGDLEEIPTPT